MALSLRDATRLVCRTYSEYLALGHEVTPGPAGRVVTNRATPSIFDANHLQRVTAEDPPSFDAAWSSLEAKLGHLAHRHVLTDPLTPPIVPALLALRGLAPKPTLQLLLEGDLRREPPAIAIREIASEADWGVLAGLLRRDHEEEARKERRPPWAQAVTDQMLATKRAKAPPFRWWIARLEDRDAGFFSSWPGIDGVGMVEDLFVQPELRRRGIARALIHHAVADARARGADRVLIGADPNDWPKRLYADLGFAPTCITWSWLKRD